MIGTPGALPKTNLSASFDGVPVVCPFFRFGTGMRHSI